MPDEIANGNAQIAQGTEPATSGTPESNGQTATVAAESEHKQVGAIPEWMAERLAKVTSQRRAAEERAAALEEQLRRANAAQGGQQQPANGAVDAEKIRADAERSALERLSKQQAEADFNSRCNAAYEAGKSQYPDFGNRVATLNMGLGENAASLYDAVTRFDPAAAPRLLAELATDMEKAQRMLTLSPYQMAAELAKMAFATPTKTVSAAPAPVAGIQSPSGAPLVDPDRMSDEEWFRARRAEVKQRR